MRLYNATSCTPCCSTWEQAPPKRKTEPHSFVPTTSISSQETNAKERINPPLQVPQNNNEAMGCPASSKPFDRGNHDGRNIGRVFGRDKINKNREASLSSKISISSEENVHVNSKFQHLLKTPSSTTTTTGGETLLCDNTSLGSRSKSKENKTEKKSTERMEFFRQDYNVYSFSNALKTGKMIYLNQKRGLAQMPKTKRENDGIRDHDYGKFLEGGKGGVSAHANDNNDNDSVEGTTDEIESTSSTLTTTRSMILQQQEECAITVNSRCYSKGSKSENGCDKEDEVPSFARSHLLPGISVKIDHMLHDSNQVQNRTMNNMKKQCAETQMSIPVEHTHCSPNKRAKPTGATTESNNELTHAKSLRNSLGGKGGPPCRTWIPINKCERTDGDDFVAAKARLRKISTSSLKEQEPERVDFFPSQRQILPQMESSRPSRLGVTSKFPSWQRRSIPDICNDGQWDIFRDTNSKRSKEEEEEEALFWVDFSSSLDQDPNALLPVSSNGSEESPFPFDTKDPANYEHCDSSAKVLLEDKSDYGKSASGDFVSVAPVPEPDMKRSQDPKRYRDIRKTLAKGGRQKRSLLRPHFLQQKPLLGPLLEARFTKSYWRRLRQKAGDDTPQKGIMDFDGLRDRRESPTNGSNQPVGSLGFQHKESFGFVAFPEDASIYVAGGNQDGKEEEAWLESRPLVLTAKRVKDCETVLAYLNTDQDVILTAIDTADSAVFVSKAHVRALQTVVPTPEEERALALCLSGSRVHHIPSKGEKFMMEMASITELRRKLEAVLFQKEFPSFVGELLADCQLYQNACQEVLGSERLQKVLGIVNLFGNRMVGRIPGRKKTSKLSLKWLEEQLEEAESNPHPRYVGEEMPSLALAVKQMDWDDFRLELANLEARLEDFRMLASNSVGDDVDILQSTTLKFFAVDACRRMESLYEAVETAEAFADDLHHIFMDEEDGKSDTVILAIISRFCDYLDRAVT